MIILNKMFNQNQKAKQIIQPNQKVQFMRQRSKVRIMIKITKGFLSIKKAVQLYKHKANQKLVQPMKRQLYLRKIKRYEEAIKQCRVAEQFFTKVIARDKFPNKFKSISWINKGLINLKANKLSDAQKCFRQSIKLSKTKSGYRNLIEILDMQTKLQQAFQVLKIYIELYPDCKWGIDAFRKYNDFFNKKADPQPLFYKEEQNERIVDQTIDQQLSQYDDKDLSDILERMEQEFKDQSKQESPVNSVKTQENNATPDENESQLDRLQRTLRNLRLQMEKTQAGLNQSKNQAKKLEKDMKSFNLQLLDRLVNQMLSEYEQ